MSKSKVPFETTLLVRDLCLCLSVQRAARALARRFDDALRPLELTHGQFSILMSLNRPVPPKMGDVAQSLSMDRTTLTAALKLLERRGLIVTRSDDDDRRSRRVALTGAGHMLLRKALPLWKRHHAQLEKYVGSGATELRENLEYLARIA
jgi:DNA-binding MarR family transcriptional regulator